MPTISGSCRPRLVSVFFLSLLSLVSLAMGRFGSEFLVFFVFLCLFTVVITGNTTICRRWPVDDDDGSGQGPTVARRTVDADGVFEGRSVGSPLGSLVWDGDGTPLNVSFFVIKVHKGGGTIPASRVVVVEVPGGYWAAGNESCPTAEGGSGDEVYVVFVRQVSPPVQELYYVADHLVPATEEVVESVKDYACAKCGLPVKVRLPKLVRVSEGRQLKLKCQTKGMLKPMIYWSKEGRPLRLDSRTKLVDRLGSTLQIKKIRHDDGGTYQCFASTSVANSTLASSRIIVTKAKYPASIHGELCERQDYCMNDGRCYFLRTLGKKFCECAKGFTGKQCILRDSTVAVSRLEQSDGSSSGLEHINKTFVVCAIVIGSILLATIVILTFCVVRLYHLKKKPLKEKDEKKLSERLPILPDGHQTIVNVNRLSCVLNQQSASDFDGTRPSANLCFPGNLSLEKVREEEPVTTTTTNSGPTQASWSGSRQSGSRPPANAKEQRRLNRLSAASDDVTSRCQSWISGNRLSMASDQLCFSNDRPPMRQHPTGKLNAGVTRLSGGAQARDRFAAISPTPETDFQPMHDLADSGGTQYDPLLESHEAVVEPEPEVAEKGDDRRSDMDVHFESEADILGMEMSFDERNERARRKSQELSELSIPTNDNRSLMTTDSEDSTLSFTEDQALLRRLSEYPFIDTNVFNRPGNIQESGSDLSWDESADVPSFAHPSLMYSGHS